jgi:hypothetical protein
MSSIELPPTWKKSEAGVDAMHLLHLLWQGVFPHLNQFGFRLRQLSR